MYGSCGKLEIMANRVAGIWDGFKERESVGIWNDSNSTADEEMVDVGVGVSFAPGEQGCSVVGQVDAHCSASPIRRTRTCV